MQVDPQRKFLLSMWLFFDDSVLVQCPKKLLAGLNIAACLFASRLESLYGLDLDSHPTSRSVVDSTTNLSIYQDCC